MRSKHVAAPGFTARRRFLCQPSNAGAGAAANDGKRDQPLHISGMRALIIIALFGLLVLAIWFAGSAWIHLGGDEIPLYGWFAITGGVLASLLVGGGLMALVFYSARHGYDDEAHRNDKTL